VGQTNLHNSNKTVFSYIYSTYTVHIQYIYSTYTVHIQCIYSAYTVHIQYIYSTYTVHIQYIYSTYNNAGWIKKLRLQTHNKMNVLFQPTIMKHQGSNSVLLLSNFNVLLSQNFPGYRQAVTITMVTKRSISQINSVIYIMIENLNMATDT
jgi:hypothetical protein